jgi:hypothetical protein
VDELRHGTELDELDEVDELDVVDELDEVVEEAWVVDVGAVVVVVDGGRVVEVVEDDEVDVVDVEVVEDDDVEATIAHAPSPMAMSASTTTAMISGVREPLGTSLPGTIGAVRRVHSVPSQ